jgi:mRNA-degrading endonuclease RelE of RelBE toxin-antitoxin system
LKLIITKPAQKDLAKLDKTTQKQIALVLDKYITGEQVDI